MRVTSNRPQWLLIGTSVLAITAAWLFTYWNIVQDREITRSTSVRSIDSLAVSLEEHFGQTLRDARNAVHAAAVLIERSGGLSTFRSTESLHQELRRELHDDASTALRAVRARLEDAQRLLESTSKEVRDVMGELRPAALDDYGLFAALHHHASAVAARLGVAVAVEGKDLEARLPLTTETALFRIAQEALNNVAKHARAGDVKVTLAETPLRVELSVTDNGVGFDTAAGAGPAGLRHGHHARARRSGRRAAADQFQPRKGHPGGNRGGEGPGMTLLAADYAGLSNSPYMPVLPLSRSPDRP